MTKLLARPVSGLEFGVQQAQTVRLRGFPAKPLRRDLPDPPEPPSRREIEQRAYFLYLERGGAGGDAAADWVAAERLLRNEFEAAMRTYRLLNS